jgi:iron complex outermembrane recepter protein
VIRVVLLLAFFLPAFASAQGTCPGTPAVFASAATYATPLDREITLRARDISLREGLDRIAASAHLRFSYSAETLPVDRRICVAYQKLAVGAALADLLAGTGVQPIPAGPDHIVLASGANHTALPEIIPLEKIVVTGSVNGMPRRALTVGVDVIAGRTLETQHATSLGEALRASVPGVWVWQQSPATVLAQYASMRGASSFGLTYPKVYLDGIEIANPLLIARIAPSSIERIETIRGPQGAALYGADAISGVVNIVTRNSASDRAERGTQASSLIGLTASGFAAETVTRQEHSIDYQVGSNLRSFAINTTGSATDEFFPNAFGRELSMLARFRAVREAATFNVVARFFGQEAGNAVSPLLIDALPVPEDSQQAFRPFVVNGAQRVVQYTLGGTVRLAGGERWTHMLVAGIDGYELNNVANNAVPIPSALDSALLASRGGADRITLRASSVARISATDRTNAAVTFAVEHSQLRKEAPEEFGGIAPEIRQVVRWQQNTGLIGQVDAALDDRFFVNGGIRLERNQALTGENKLATLPMIGAAYVRDLGGTSVKLRSAYGKGIRPPESGVREIAHQSNPGSPGDFGLDPEVQAGSEFGADVWIGSNASLQVTRFDQSASGLIQQVGVGTTQTGPGPQRPIGYVFQNVGEISNEGWELEAAYQKGIVDLALNFAIVDSRVRKLATGYTGDLRPGDRMLNVPARTASLTTSVTPGNWSVSITASRAFDWIGYDRSGLVAAYADADRPTSGFLGSQLRAYWREYGGVTWLRASASYSIAPRWTLRAVGENLLNHQQGEPDDITILPGRTVNVGVQLKF